MKLEVIFVSLHILSFDPFYIPNTPDKKHETSRQTKQQYTEVQNRTEFISKQPCQFLVFTFCHSSLNSVSIPEY